MEKVESTHLITDFKSLEDEALTLLGLDIDDAMENSKVYGTQIKRKNHLVQSIVALVVLIAVIGTATFLTIESRKETTVANKSLRSFDAKPLTPKPLAQTPTPVSAAVETPAQEVVAPFVYPTFEMGNAALCTSPTFEAPGPNDPPVVGSTLNVERYMPTRDGETHAVEGTPGLTFKLDASAPGGQYLIFSNNSFANGSYRMQSANSLAYCDGNNIVKISQDGKGYNISQERW